MLSCRLLIHHSSFRIHHFRSTGMKNFNLCLLGFGNVARALVPLLVEKSEEMREQFRIEWRVTGVATRRAGWRAAPGGFGVEELLSGGIASQVSPQREGVKEWPASARGEVHLETTALEPRTGEPAITPATAASEAGA